MHQDPKSCHQSSLNLKVVSFKGTCNQPSVLSSKSSSHKNFSQLRTSSADLKKSQASIMDSYNGIHGALDDISNNVTADTDKNHDFKHEYTIPENPAMDSEERNVEVRKQGWTERVAIKYDEVAQADTYEYAGNASRYEWAGNEGDVGPRNEELEGMLFNGSLLPRAGHRIEEYVISFSASALLL